MTNRPVGEGWKFWLHLSNWRADLGISSNIFTWHFWSLAIEEQFYFVWPMVVAILPVRWIGLVCLMTAAGSVTFRGIAAWSGADVETLHRSTLMALDGLAIGSCLAWMVRYQPARADRLVRLSLPVCLAAAFAIWSLGRLNLSFPTVLVVGRLLVSVGGGALVLVAVGGPAPVIRMLSCRPLRIPGQYCYGLYLLHPIIVVKGMVPARWLASHVPTQLLPLAWILSLTAGLGASFLLARISWRVLEAPCLSLKRLFPYRPSTKVVPSSSPTGSKPGGTRAHPAHASTITSRVIALASRTSPGRGASEQVADVAVHDHFPGARAGASITVVSDQPRPENPTPERADLE